MEKPRRMLFVLLLGFLIAACSSDAELPDTYDTWRLPAPGEGRDLRLPVVWLGAAGDEALPGTGVSFSIADKNADEAAETGMPASPAELGAQLARAELPQDQSAVVIIAGDKGTVRSVNASYQLWTAEAMENFALFAGKTVAGTGKQEGDLYTYTLEPLGTSADALLVAAVEFDNRRASGDIVLIWRLNPGASSGTEPPVISTGGEPALDVTSFLDALRLGGAEAEPAGAFTSALFTGTPQLLRVNGIDIQVYEYADPASAELEAGYIAPDGSTITVPDPSKPDSRQVSMVEWIAAPHFYRAGRLIVQYVGDDQALIQLLISVLGPQFAGGVSESRLPLVVGEIEPAEGAPMSFEEAVRQAPNVVLAEVVGVEQGPDYVGNVEIPLCKPSQLVTVKILEVYKGSLMVNRTQTIYQQAGVTDSDTGCGANPESEKVVMIMSHDPLYEINQHYLLAAAPLSDSLDPDPAIEAANAELAALVDTLEPVQVLYNGRLYVEQGGNARLSQAGVHLPAYDDFGRAVPGPSTGHALAGYRTLIARWLADTSSANQTELSPPRTKPVWLRFESSSGDAPWSYPYEYSIYSIPHLLVYADGQTIVRGTEQIAAAVLSNAEMCGLLAAVAETGFFQVEGDGRLHRDDPIYNLPQDFFWGDGLPFIFIQVNGELRKSVMIYSHEDVVGALIDEVRDAYDVIREFRPAEASPYYPDIMMLWIAKAEEGAISDIASLPPWPPDLPPLVELLKGKTEGSVTLRDELIDPFMALLPPGPKERYFQEGGIAYLVIGRPLLPHENPGRFGGIPNQAIALAGPVCR